jgi:hypothetical protein
MSEVLDMPIALVWSFPVVHMYWYATLGPINMYDYRVLIYILSVLKKQESTL